VRNKEGETPPKVWGTLGGSHKNPLIVSCISYMIRTWYDWQQFIFNKNWTLLQFANKTNALYQQYNWTSCYLGYFERILTTALKHVTMRSISSWQRLRGGASGVGPESGPLDPVHGRCRTWELVTLPKVLLYFVHCFCVFPCWNNRAGRTDEWTTVSSHIRQLLTTRSKTFTRSPIGI